MKLTVDVLQNITLKILNDYKDNNNDNLFYLYDLFFDNDQSTKTPRAVFLKLIKNFHPDRFEILSKKLDLAKQNNDELILNKFKNLMQVKLEKKKNYSPVYHNTKEEFGWDATEFGMSQNINSFECEIDQDIDEMESDDFQFVEALKRQQMGNLDFYLSPSDLNSLEGEINLSCEGIRDLSGLEYCINITILDLSTNNLDNVFEISKLIYLKELYLANNNISDLKPFKELDSLEILDIRNNDIEDFSPLLNLISLKLVYILDNPGIKTDKKTIELLKKKGVIII